MNKTTSFQKPLDWLTVTVDDISSDILSGGTPSTKVPGYWAGTIPWITSKWLNEELYLRSGEKFISIEALMNSATKIVPSGNVILATRVGVGKGAVNKIDIAINQDLAGIIVDKERILPEFLAYQFRTNSIQKFIYQNKRGATIKGITKACVREVRLTIPPLKEQRRIAAVLSLVQRAIEQQERLIALTTELKKALMHKLFTEGTRGEPKKQTEIGQVPESWQVVEIGDLFKFTSGRTKPKDTGPNASNRRMHPVYGGNGILGYSSKHLLEKGTLVLGRVGEYCGCAHLTMPFSWITDNALYIKEERAKVNQFYIRNHFEYLNLNKYSNKMGQPLITQGIINRVKFGLPTREEQNELAEIFEKIDIRFSNFRLGSCSRIWEKKL